MPDDATRPRHLLDQLGGHLEAMAPALAKYYRDLTAAGIPPEQAIQLVRDAQARMWGAQRNDAE